MKHCAVILGSNPEAAANLVSAADGIMTCVTSAGREEAMAFLRGNGCRILITFPTDDLSALIEEARETSPGTLVAVACLEDSDVHESLFYAGADDYLAVSGSKKQLSFDLMRLLRASELRQEEEEHRRELLKQENLKSIGYIARGIAHDFNNILAAILGYIEVADTTLETGSRESVRSLLGGAAHAVAQSRKITATLLTFAEGGPPITEKIRLDTFFERYHLPKLTREKVSVTVESDGDIPSVNADPDLLNQVIGNILDNALSSLGNSGAIHVRCTRQEASANPLIPAASGTFAAISVKDNGTGISPEVLPHIFDPYFSTRGKGAEKGVGLGLAICYSIVQRHQGYIRAESEPGMGTRITVFLPAVEAEAAEDPFVLEDSIATRGHESEDPAVGHRPKVLIMDDEALMRDVVAKSLLSMGYEPVMAEEGCEAVAVYKKAFLAGERFFAVILDLTSNIGMGGLETLKQLKEIDPEVRGLVASGYSDDPVLNRSSEFGFSGALEKPFRYTDLKSALEKLA